MYNRITILRAAFGARDFSTAEARLALNIPDASAALSRLKAAGFIERVARGRYRLAAPESSVDVEFRRREEIVAGVLSLPIGVALDGPDAVSAWTEGRYSTGALPGNRLLYLAVDTRHRARLLRALKLAGVPWSGPEGWPRGKGVLALVRGVPNLRRVMRDGVPVVTREETLRIIRADPAAYEGAQEWMPP